jgi:hypothetical protein
MHGTPSEVIVASWLVFALYWLVAALGVKRTAKRQSPSERMLYLVFMAAGFFLLYQENPSWGLLNHRFLPDQLWIAWLGSALCAAGVLFALWARRTIGKDWSAEVQIKEGHQLIRSGPYARIRHPFIRAFCSRRSAPPWSSANIVACSPRSCFWSASPVKPARKNRSWRLNSARPLTNTAATPGSFYPVFPDKTAAFLGAPLRFRLLFAGVFAYRFAGIPLAAAFPCHH